MDSDGNEYRISTSSIGERETHVTVRKPGAAADLLWFEVKGEEPLSSFWYPQIRTGIAVHSDNRIFVFYYVLGCRSAANVIQVFAFS